MSMKMSWTECGPSEKREEATETEIPFPPEPSGSPVQFDRMVQPNSRARSVRKGSVSRKRMMILK